MKKLVAFVWFSVLLFVSYINYDIFYYEYLRKKGLQSISQVKSVFQVIQKVEKDNQLQTSNSNNPSFFSFYYPQCRDYTIRVIPTSCIVSENSTYQADLLVNVYSSQIKPRMTVSRGKVVVKDLEGHISLQNAESISKQVNQTLEGYITIKQADGSDITISKRVTYKIKPKRK